MTIRRTTFAAFAALLAAFAAPAAEPPGAWTPPTLKEPRLTLGDAIRITLESDPNLKLSEARALSQQGAYQIQSGAFDPVLSGNGDWTFTQTALTFSETEAEKKRRTDLQKDIDEAQQEANTKQFEVSELRKLAADPENYKISAPSLIAAGIPLVVNSLNAQIAAATDPVKKAALIAQRDAYIQYQVDNYAQQLGDWNAEVARNTTNLQKLGDVPTVRQDHEVDLGIDLSFPYRSGVTLGLFANGTYTATKYKGKTKLSEEGGLGIEDLYKYEIGFSVDAHLLRGRGEDATAAFETSARIDWDASRAVLEHQASQSVLATIDAYWGLAAAQELLDVAKRSAALHGRRLEVTKALIQGDEIPRAELSRELASQANDEALVRSAERSVGEARLSLARTMGIQVTSEAEAPIAADPLPEAADRAALDALAPAPLIAAALANRRDRVAAERLRESGGVLVRAAETALRPKLDANGSLKAGTVAETSLARTVNGWSGPSFSIGLSLEAPIGNNEAKGRLLQAQADLAQRSVTAADLDRNIRANVVQGIATLRASADQLERMKEAVGLYGKTIDAELERFRAGQSSLLDSIVTQDLQTNALFTFAVARQQYASLLARLRYETGTLVTREGERNVVRPGDLLKPPSVVGK